MITGFFVSFGMFGAVLYVPLTIRVCRDQRHERGLLVTPMMLGLVVRAHHGRSSPASIATASWAPPGPRDDGRPVPPAQVRVGTSELEVVRALLLVGMGLGVTFPLYINATQSAVARQYLGVVSSQIQFWRNVGGTIGVSILGAVLSHQLPVNIRASIDALNLPAQAAAAIPAGSSPEAIFDQANIAATRAICRRRSSRSSIRSSPRCARARAHDPRRVPHATAIVAIAAVRRSSSRGPHPRHSPRERANRGAQPSALAPVGFDQNWVHPRREAFPTDFAKSH